MKKKWTAWILSCALALSLGGCGSGVSDDHITIKKYKKLEIPKLELTEVTDSDVENAINSQLNQSQERRAITDRPAQ